MTQKSADYADDVTKLKNYSVKEKEKAKQQALMVFKDDTIKITT